MEAAIKAIEAEQEAWNNRLTHLRLGNEYVKKLNPGITEEKCLAVLSELETAITILKNYKG